MNLRIPLAILTAITFVGCIKCPDGTPDPNCVCILIYDPVCGCDNVTYGNSCQAVCAGIDDYKDGECF